MKTKLSHTPEKDAQILITQAAELGKKPWHVVDGISRLIIDWQGNEIALCGNNALAIEITNAVNNHEVLLNAIKDIRKAFYVDGTSKAVREAFARHNEFLIEALAVHWLNGREVNDHA